MSKTNDRRVVRSACGTYDYIMEGDETICTLRVPAVETWKYSCRVADLVALPDVIADWLASHEVLNAAGVANSDDGQTAMPLCERIELLIKSHGDSGQRGDGMKRAFRIGANARLEITYQCANGCIMFKGVRYPIVGVCEDGAVALAHPAHGGQVWFTKYEVTA